MAVLWNPQGRRVATSSDSVTGAATIRRKLKSDDQLSLLRGLWPPVAIFQRYDSSRGGIGRVRGIGSIRTPSTRRDFSASHRNAVCLAFPRKNRSCVSAAREGRLMGLRCMEPRSSPRPGDKTLTAGTKRLGGGISDRCLTWEQSRSPVLRGPVRKRPRQRGRH